MSEGGRLDPPLAAVDTHAGEALDLRGQPVEPLVGPVEVRLVDHPAEDHDRRTAQDDGDPGAEGEPQLRRHATSLPWRARRGANSR